MESNRFNYLKFAAIFRSAQYLVEKWQQISNWMAQGIQNHITQIKYIANMKKNVTSVFS